MPARSTSSTSIPAGATSRAASTGRRLYDPRRKLPAIATTRKPAPFSSTFLSNPMPVPSIPGHDRAFQHGGAAGQSPDRRRRPDSADYRRTTTVLLLLSRLDLERDLDGVADEHAAGLQGDVPGRAELLAADRR